MKVLRAMGHFVLLSTDHVDLLREQEVSKRIFGGARDSDASLYHVLISKAWLS